MVVLAGFSPSIDAVGSVLCVYICRKQHRVRQEVTCLTIDQLLGSFNINSTLPGTALNMTADVTRQAYSITWCGLLCIVEWCNRCVIKLVGQPLCRIWCFLYRAWFSNDSFLISSVYWLTSTCMYMYTHVRVHVACMHIYGAGAHGAHVVVIRRCPWRFSDVPSTFIELS